MAGLAELEEEIEPAYVDLQHDGADLDASRDLCRLGQADVLAGATRVCRVEALLEHVLGVARRVVGNRPWRLRRGVRRRPRPL